MGTDAAGGHAHTVRARIARGIVTLLKENYGRGPEGAKAYLVDDAVLVVLSGGFTRAEATLLAAGHGQSVKDQRALFQDSMRQRFCDLIEGETGRKVKSLMSANDQDADVFCQVFLLEPLTQDADTDTDG